MYTVNILMSQYYSCAKVNLLYTQKWKLMKWAFFCHHYKLVLMWMWHHLLFHYNCYVTNGKPVIPHVHFIRIRHEWQVLWRINFNDYCIGLNRLFSIQIQSHIEVCMLSHYILSWFIWVYGLRGQKYKTFLNILVIFVNYSYKLNYIFITSGGL